MNASLRVEEDQTVLVRSTETKSDAANGVNQRIVLTAVDLPPDTADIDIDHVGRRIEMQIPYVLQEHGTRDHLTGIAGQVRQQTELSRQQLDFATTSAGDPRQHFTECERLDEIIVTACTQAAHAIVDFTKSAKDQRRREDPLFPYAANNLDPVDLRQHAVNRHHDI